MDDRAPANKQNQPEASHGVVNPSPEVVEQKKIIDEENQAAKNFVGNSMPTESTSDHLKRFTKEQLKPVAGLFTGVVGIFVLSLFYNVPTIVVFLASSLFIAYIIWQLFLLFRDM